MTEFEQFLADVHNAFELIGGQKSYDTFVRLISASGTQQEENRIIKLIEPLGCPANGIEHHCENNLSLYTANDLIALIKGEK